MPDSAPLRKDKMVQIKPIMAFIYHSIQNLHNGKNEKKTSGQCSLTLENLTDQIKVNLFLVLTNYNCKLNQLVALNADRNSPAVTNKFRFHGIVHFCCLLNTLLCYIIIKAAQINSSPQLQTCDLIFK